VRRELSDDRLARLQVHQDPEQEHRVEDLAAGGRGQPADRARAHGHPVPDLCGLAAEPGQERVAHPGIGLDGEHPVPGAGQPDGLRSLPRAHIQDQRGRRRQVTVELAGDQLLPDDVAHVAEMAEPARTAIAERAASAEGLYV
jgi:hypothetical protein